ncbi:hypothetical protein FOA52_014723 [Chlamydomonas sp. UWO 241]|nr:hypothetical protein FOA52_014723 [Chlamydomonas sp. UWO 241]
MQLCFEGGDAAVSNATPLSATASTPTGRVRDPPTQPSSFSPQPGGGGDKDKDYYANVGDAIRALRADIPNLFKKDLNYEIYREDIVFVDPRNTIKGKKNYRILFWSLRFHGAIFFSNLYVEVKRVWQPEDDVIKMRWTVHGIPRVPWEAEGLFDGISSYKLDRHGKIYEHAVDNVLLSDDWSMLNNPFAGLAGLNFSPRMGGPQLGASLVQGHSGVLPASSRLSPSEREPAAAAAAAPRGDGGGRGAAAGHAGGVPTSSCAGFAAGATQREEALGGDGTEVSDSWRRLYGALSATAAIMAVLPQQQQRAGVEGGDAVRGAATAAEAQRVLATEA